MKKNLSRYMSVLLLIALCSCTTYNSLNAKDFGSAPMRSAGCGKPQKGSGNYIPIKIRVLDTDRSYYLRIPRSYDPDRAYPLVFRWHGSGGSGLSGGTNIEYISGDNAIVVGADGMNKYWSPQMDTGNLLFFDRMLETIENQYCIDRKRIFSFGFSSGGFFSNVLACARSDVLRGNAVIASGTRGGIHCRGKVATWLLHDQDDKIIPIEMGKAARDKAIAMNGCSTNTIDDDDGCVRYQGCNTAPVVWCESKGIGHNVRADFAPARVWKFFQSLR